MNFLELVAVAQAIAERIDVQWGFFLTIHLALLGGIIYVDRPLSAIEKSIGAVLYLTFAVLNYRLLRLQQSLMISAYEDIAALRGEPALADSRLLEFYVAAVDAGIGKRIFVITVTVHLVAMIVIILSIIADREKRA